jgi:hypothetical protein
MIQPEMWKRIHDDVLASWSVIGPLVYALAGVLVGAHITNRNQREQWIADNKRLEYRELLTTLAKSFASIVELHASGVALGPEEQRKQMNLEVVGSAVILDRILIADEVLKMGISNRWNQALRAYDSSLDSKAFGTAFGRIRIDLKNSAMAAMVKSKRFGGWLKKWPFTVGKLGKP